MPTVSWTNVQDHGCDLDLRCNPSKATTCPAPSSSSSSEVEPVHKAWNSSFTNTMLPEQEDRVENDGKHDFTVCTYSALASIKGLITEGDRLPLHQLWDSSCSEDESLHGQDHQNCSIAPQSPDTYPIVTHSMTVGELADTFAGTLAGHPSVYDDWTSKPATIAGEPTEEAPAAWQVRQNDMDQTLMHCFLQAVKIHLKDSDLPIMGITLYVKFMRGCRQIGSSCALADSSFASLRGFLELLEKEGLVELNQELRDPEVVGINRTHPLIRSWEPWPPIETVASQRKRKNDRCP